MLTHNFVIKINLGEYSEICTRVFADFTIVLIKVSTHRCLYRERISDLAIARYSEVFHRTLIVPTMYII